MLGCNTTDENPPSSRFERISVQDHGIVFQNQLKYTEEVNPYTYKSFYNGGGVAIGDLDNDGLVDVIFTGNQVDNAIYRNLGSWKFEDVSENSGLLGQGSWTSGVSLADVNGDGLLDVYLCKSGPPTGSNRRNELRINNGDWTFTDVSEEAGVNDYGLSVQAAFFDFDKDGDLDMYLLNNSIRSVGGYDIREGQRDIRDSLGGNRLYRNELVPTGRLKFTDVSEAAGIYGSDIGFGLGVSIADINQDTWPDIYVSNDFFERDYLYLNKGDGSFAERLTEIAPELSLGAMGADVADLTGDAYPEIFVTEMRPATAIRLKSKTKFESWDKFFLAESKGYHKQFSRNTLLQNIKGEALVDVSRQAGVAATDWSWGALAVDLDNDGWRDLYVANGIYKDLLDQDYIHFVANADNIRTWIASGQNVIERLVDSMPTEALSNYAFRNENKGLRFSDSTGSWGLDIPSFSNGSAYGDLDNDGDLDLVINTISDFPLIYQNHTTGDKPSSTNYLGFELYDTLSYANFFATGTQIIIWVDGERQTAELSPYKGFMSTVDNRILFGLNKHQFVDSIKVVWPDGAIQRYLQTSANQYIKVVKEVSGITKANALKTDSAKKWRSISNWEHQESAHDDFDRYPLLIEMFSSEGPATACLRKDHSTLVFIGGGPNQAAKLIERANNEYNDITPEAFQNDSDFEDVAATWIDIDNDGDSDLFVASGGDEAPEISGSVRLRLYENKEGKLVAGKRGSFPSLVGFSCGALTPWDYDQDGDYDLFFGTHFRVGQYGIPAESFLLANDGSGNFSLANDSVGARIRKLSNVRAAVTGNFFGSGSTHLAIAQEYGPVSVLATDKARLIHNIESKNGLWRALMSIDTDADGIDELVAGNLGLNTIFLASEDEPLTQYIGDFDNNGQVEQITTCWMGGEETVIHQLLDLVSQVPSLRKKFPRFESYATANPFAIIDTTRLLDVRKVTELQSGILQVSERKLDFTPFPPEAQTSCARAFAYLPDSIGGGQVFIGGNYTRFKPEIGGQSGSVGSTVEFEAQGDMKIIPWRFPPLFGETRALFVIDSSILAVQNNDSILHYEF